MPRISEFYGIAIYMYFRDHAPPFHAIYGEFDAEIDIETGAVREGDLPRSARRLVREWTGLHRIELRENWTRAESGTPLNPVEPLE
jgi:hypothetical protein